MDKKLFVEMSRKATPSYLFDIDAFHERAKHYKDVLGEGININFCMKANPFLTEASLDFTDRIEVCSFGEFEITRELKIPPEKLLISGVLKKEEDLEEIVSYCGRGAIYTAESLLQVEEIDKAARKYGFKARIYMRLTSGNQFGMDEDTIFEILKNFDSYPNLEFYGIHFFTGTQKHKIRIHEKEINKLSDFIKRLGDSGYKVGHLEYGTGFGVPYFIDQNEDATSDDFLKEFALLLEKMDFDGEISLEMGRALAFDCGYYFSKVRDLKTNCGKKYLILDGGINHINYDGQLRGMYIPFIDLIRGNEVKALYDSSEKAETTYTVCGSLCTTNDIIVSGLKADDININDILVFERTGAYSFYEGMQLFLSHELPSVSLYSRRFGLKEVRKETETFKLNM